MADGAAAGPSRLLVPHRPLLVLTLLALSLYLPCVWLRDVWAPDEPRYAEVMREMVSRGDYILPHLNGEVYSEKPPVFFWLGILAGLLPGIPPDAGSRLVSALASLGTLLLTWRIFSRLGNPRTAWLACIILATSWMFVTHATSGVIDATQSFLITAAIAAGMAARRERSFVLWAVFYGAIGVALITKGPVGLAIPAGVLILMTVQEDGPAGLRARHPLWGLPLAAFIASLWLFPVILKGGPEYAHVILFKQNIGRAYEAFHHAEPIHYFFSVFPGSFLPWVLLLPGGIWLAVTQMKDRQMRDRQTVGTAESAAARLALTWFGFTFLFFSVISGKKTRYLLPLFPAASWLAALELRALVVPAAGSGWAARLRPRFTAGLCAAVMFTLAIGLIAAGAGLLGEPAARIEGLSDEQASALSWYASPPGGLLLIVPGIAAAVLGAGALWSLRRRPARAAACVLACVIVVIGAAQWIGLSALNHVKSAMPLARIVERAAGPGGAVIMYRDQHSGLFNVALRRDHITEMSHNVITADHLEANPGMVVIAVAADMERLKRVHPGLRVLGCRRVGEEVICAGQS